MTTSFDSSVIVPYRCPRCESDLQRGGGGLECGSGHRYPVRGAVPVFLARSDGEGAPTEERLTRLNQAAREHGWREALDIAFSDEPEHVRYVTDESRLQLLDLLPLDATSTVLEVGCSLGQVTEHLARRVDGLCALEVVPEQAEFAALRCRQEGLENVQVACAGDDCRIPFPSNAFDVVVLNLVLEWCGQRGTEAFASSQQRMLRECSRVLRPGGHLFVATKNRFSIHLLVGGQDEHTDNLRFGSAAPRWLLRVLSRACGRPPKGRLYSLRELRRALRAAGFDEMDLYWAIPHPRYPACHVPFERNAINAARRRLAEGGRMGPLTRLLLWLPTHMTRHLTPGLSIVARKS